MLLLAVFFLPEAVNGIDTLSLARPTISPSANYDLVLDPFVPPLQAPDFFAIQKNSFKAVAGTTSLNPQVLATLSGQEDELGARRGIVEYLAQAGDTLTSISQSFNISLETLLWANNLTKSSNLMPGQKLIILPVSGTMHLTRAGDTLGAIVKKYNGNLDQTIAFNELQDENDLSIGDIIIIPDGIMPVAPVVKKPVVLLAPLASGYFICPIAGPCRVTQGLHWYNAIDFSHGSCGEPILAAAAGVVQKVKLTTSTSKWALGGAGNHITILHPNGVVTYYGHLASSLVSVGDNVSQGQVIAYMGGGRGMAGAGLSTGCHVHFQVVGARNPFSP